jgi:hypothetical protein
MRKREMFAARKSRAIAVLLMALALSLCWALLSLWPLRLAHARDNGLIFARSRLLATARSRACPPYCNPIVRARDNGQYANSPLKSWFDQLASKKGLCCSFADGFSLADVDWDVQCATAAGVEQCRYRVRLDGEWVEVPDEAVVTEPNRYGRAVVWPYRDTNGTTQIRCFLPGAGA